MTNNVPQEILNQLGNRRFKMMTGARVIDVPFLNDDENTLRFSLPRNFAKNGINEVSIRLNALDTYDVKYIKRGNKIKGNTKRTVIETSKGIYCDMLQRDFKDNTGLDTRL